MVKGWRKVKNPLIMCFNLLIPRLYHGITSEHNSQTPVEEDPVAEVTGFTMEVHDEPRLLLMLKLMEEELEDTFHENELDVMRLLAEAAAIKDDPGRVNALKKQADALEDMNGDNAEWIKSFKDLRRAIVKNSQAAQFKLSDRQLDTTKKAVEWNAGRTWIQIDGVPERQPNN